MTQPRTANRPKSSLPHFMPRAAKSAAPDSTTIKPRVILPPSTLYSRTLRIHATSGARTSYDIASSSHDSSMSRGATLEKDAFFAAGLDMS